MLEKPFYVKILSEELERRKSQEPDYSLRQFASELGLHSSTLSGVLRGRRPFPWRHSKLIAEKLQMSQETFEKFIGSVHKDAGIADLNNSSETPVKILELDKYCSVIEDWEYFSVLNYFSLKSCDQSLQAIAKRFAITEERAEKVVRELIEYGFLKKENSTISRSVTNVSTTEDIPSESLRTAHLQEMDLVKRRMNEVETLMRDISSVTFTGDSKKIKLAKKMIRAFRKKITNLMETDASDNVYLLSVQLVPITLPLQENKSI